MRPVRVADASCHRSQERRAQQGADLLAFHSAPGSLPLCCLVRICESCFHNVSFHFPGYPFAVASIVSGENPRDAFLSTFLRVLFFRELLIKGTKAGFGAHTALSPKPAIPPHKEDICGSSTISVDLMSAGFQAPRSPSPRPSPQGRGRTLLRAQSNRGILALSKSGRRCSLSLRERVGVRGKSADELRIRALAIGSHPLELGCL